MNIGQVEYAERKALEVFDKWNEVANIVEPGTGSYAEIKSVIEDAVHVGLQMALFGNVKFNPDGELIRERKLDDK